MMETTCQYTYLYRLLRSDENPQENGITAKLPTANVSVHDHVSGGSYAPSQFISTSATWGAVLMFSAKSQTLHKRVATINAEALTGTGFYDLTNEPNRNYWLKDDWAKNCARKFNEVLIVGGIPPSCIVRVDPIDKQQL